MHCGINMADCRDGHVKNQNAVEESHLPTILPDYYHSHYYYHSCFFPPTHLLTYDLLPMDYPTDALMPIDHCTLPQLPMFMETCRHTKLQHTSTQRLQTCCKEIVRHIAAGSMHSKTFKAQHGASIDAQMIPIAASSKTSFETVSPPLGGNVQGMPPPLGGNVQGMHQAIAHHH